MKAFPPQRIFLAVATLVAVCLAAPVVARGQRGEEAAVWQSVRTKNFLILRRGRAEDARRAAARLEQFNAVLSTVFARLLEGERAGPRAPTTVILFPNDAVYAPFKPVFDGRTAGGVAGHFQSSPEANYIALSLASERGDDDSSTMLHEYAHLLINGYFRAAPVWLKEGLSEFYSTTRISGGRVTFGGAIKARQQLLRRQATQLVPLATLLEADEHSPLYRDASKRALFYSEAWAFVHYLLNGNDARRAQFTRYLAALASDEDQMASFRAAFGDDLGPLEAELVAYANRSTYPERVEPLEKGLAFDAPPAGGPLADAEFAAYLGDMLLRGGRDVEAETYLRRALDADARLASAHTSLGALRLRQGRQEEATRLLRRAVELDPQNHLARFHLADSMRRAGADGVINAADFDEHTRLILAELRRSIELAPDFLEAYKVFALVVFERGDEIGEATTLLERAMRMAPRRREFPLLLAQARMRAGDFAAARALVGAATLRGGDAKLLAHAEKLRGFIAAREEARRKAQAEAAQSDVAAPSEPTQPCDMPDPGPYHKRLRFKGEQVCGQLVQIECEDDGIVLFVAAGERTLRLRGEAFNRIRFVTYTTEVKTGQLTCGPRAPANPVLVTYRARKKEAASVFDGEVIAVEFVPPDWNH